MKKILCVLLSAVMLLLPFSVTAFAEDVSTGELSTSQTETTVYEAPHWSGDKSYYYVNNEPAKGFLTIGSKTYYFDEETGVKATGLVEIDGGYYYFSKNGVLKYGWKNINGERYYFSKKNGKAVTGMKKISGKKYFFSDEGKMQIGWIEYNGNTYFFVRNKKNKEYYGSMLTGSAVIDGKTYIFSKKGVLIGEDDEMSMKAKSYSSKTNYLILVDKKAHKVGIYKGEKNNWSRVQFYDCTIGAKATPTPSGDFEMGAKNGRPFHQVYFDSGKVRCWYASRIVRGINFHSVLYTQNSKPSKISDGRLGKNLSHGCVRLKIKNAKWIYDNIPSGTRCIIY